MEKPPRIDDEEVERRLQAAWAALGTERGESDFGNNVLEAARRVLSGLYAASVVRPADQAMQRIIRSAASARRRSD